MEEMYSRHEYFLTCLDAAILWSVPGTAQEPGNAELFQSACAGCHEEDGKGVAKEDSALEILPPDFAESQFASRELDTDWYGALHDGGPVRAFDRKRNAARLAESRISTSTGRS